MRKRYVPLAFLVLSVAVAGCTDPLGGQDQDDRTYTFTQNDGLSISFTAANAEFFQDEQYSFTATASNTGQGVADVSRMELFGPSWVSGNSKSNLGDLQPVERANEIPGEQLSRTFTGSIDTDIRRGQSDSYTVRLRTIYGYKSRTRSDITVMTRDEFRDSGTPQRMRNDVRGAPIKISFDGTTPLPARSGGTVSVPVKVTNVGDGSPTDDEIGSITVRVEGRGQQCSRSGFRLFEDSRTFTCQVSVPALSGSNPVPETSVTLIATADYDYEEIDSTSVEVIGTGGSGGGGATNNNGGGSDNGDNGGDGGDSAGSPALRASADEFCEDEGYDRAVRSQNDDVCFDRDKANTLEDNWDDAGDAEVFSSGSHNVDCPDYAPRVVCVR